MSKKVDERVVEMRFDNQQFESGVKTTMSTLDKLKAALKFPSSTKSLDSISNAAKKVDFSGMQKGIETVNARFSAMQVVGMTALSNITSAAMRAGTNLVKSFTIDPVVSGFKEYELQMNSIQTILANTKSKGTTMSDVTAALDELNEYADLTIYNFAEMTKNIGTFTAAGVDLNTAVGAIKGIANLGAMSSSTSTQVNTAMYQLSQALATGRVSLMDWNSVVNAGMGGEQFQNALKRTAKNFGYDVDGMIKKYGSFRESLTQGGWLTADVLKETLNQIGGAYDATALKAKGYSDDQIAAILDLADTATKAATEVKTFTQLMDTLKEAAGSGFAKMWQNIFGDFEQAKEFFSGLHEMLEPIVTGPIDAINSVIEGAMGGGGSRWSEFTGQLDKAGVSVDSFQKKLSEVASAKGVDLSGLIKEYGSLEKAMASGKITSDMVSEALGGLAASTDNVTASTRSLAEWQKVVDDVWYGTYGNIDTGRVERLAAAGWEYAEVQKLVNMTVDGHRLTLEDLTAAQIESMGYTKEQSEALANLAAEAKKSGGDINTLINDILAPKRSGRELFLEGLENVLTAIIKPLQAVGKAFSEVFGIDSDGLYELIEGFNEFSKEIIMAPDDLEKLQSTFKGLFSIVHLLATGFGKTLTLALKAVNAVLAPFGTDLLSITGVIGEAIYYFDQWVTSGTVIEDVLSGIGDVFSWIIEPMSGFFEGFASLPGISTALEFFGGLLDGILGYFKKFNGLGSGTIFKEILRDVQDFLGGFQDTFNKIKNLTWEDVLDGLTGFGKKVGEFFTNLIEDMKEIGPDIIEGLQNGLLDGAEGIVKFLQDLGTKIIEAICAVLGIHSPSTVFFEIGTNIVQGLCNGIRYLSDEVSGVIYDLVEDIKYALSGVDWGVVIPVAGAIGAFAILYQMTDALQGFAQAAKDFASPMKSISNLGGSLKTTVDGFNNLMGFTQNNTSIKFKQMAEGVKILAEAIAILAGSVVALTVVDQSKLRGALLTIGGLAAIIGALAWALNRFATGGQVLEALQLNTTLLSLGATFALLAVSAKILSGIDETGFENAKDMITLFASVITALIVVSAFGGARIGAATIFLDQIGKAFLLLGIAARLLGGMDRSSMNSAQEMITTFAAVVIALMAISIIGGPRASACIQFLSQIGIAFLLLGVAARLLGGMDAGSMRSAQEMMLSFAGIVGIFMILARFGGAKAGAATMFLSQVGIAFLALGAAARLLGGLSKDEIENAKEALWAFTGVISVLMIVGSLAKGVSKGVASSILSMSLAIGVLAGVAVLLSYVKLENMYQGVAVVTAFGLLVSLMAKSARGVRDVKGTMIGMAVAIGVMAAAVAVLSFIRPDKLYGAAAALGFLILTLAAAIAASGKAATKVGPLIAILAVVTASAAAVKILAEMKPENVISSALGLSALMVALAVTMRILAKVHSVSKTAIGGVYALLPVVSILGGIISAMNGIDPLGAVVNATALGVLVNALSAALVIMANVKNVSGEAIGGVYALTVVVGALSVIIGSMNGLNPLNSVANALALSVLVNALAFALNAMAQVKNVSLEAVGGIAVLTLVVGALSVIIGSMNDLNPAASIGNAIALGILINALAAAAAILGFASAAIAGAAATIGPFLIVMAGITAIVAAAGAIALIPGATWLMNQGAELLGAIGNAIGSFVGGIIGGVASGVTNALPQIGANLSSFAENLEPFMAVIGSIDPSFADSMGAFASGLLAITGAGLLDKLSAIFGDKKSGIQQLSENLPIFGEALAGFANSLDGSNMANVAIGAQAFKALAEAMATIPSEGGFMGLLTGGKDYSGFADGMEDIAAGLVAFDEKTTGIQVDTITTRVNALKTVMEALSGVPNTGGWLQMLLGEQNWDNYSTGMGAMAEGLATFDTNTQGIQTEGIIERVNALKAVMEALSSVPNSGGFLQKLLGEQNWEGYATGMTQIALGLWNFDYYTKSIEDFERFNSIVDSLKLLIGGLATIPSEGGLLDTLFGDGTVDYQKFASGLVSIGGAMGKFAEQTAGIEDTAVLTSVVNSTRALMDGLANINAEGGLLDQMMSGGETFATFSTSLTALGGAISAYAGSVANATYDNVSASIAAARSVLSFINDTAGLDTSGVLSFVLAVNTLASANISEMLEVFNAASADFAESGKGLIQAVADGISGNQSSVVDAVSAAMSDAKSEANDSAGEFGETGENIVSEVVDGIDSSGGDIGTELNSAITDAKNNADTSGFYSVGRNIVNGVSSGIRDYASSVARAAAQMVTDAKNAANAAADSHSPSRVFRYQVAAFMGQGMVLGLKDYQPEAKKAGSGLGRSAIDGVSSTISMLSDALNTDLDVNPTIRPVLDLSDVRSGADSINGMFDSLVPMNVLGRVNSISRSMDSRIQNGSFNDVVGAIDKLRTNLSELGGTTYNVNGVTYDDGTNVANAVNDLTRAIRLERRV